jgi:hypothetical protein
VQSVLVSKLEEVKAQAEQLSQELSAAKTSHSALQSTVERLSKEKVRFSIFRLKLSSLGDTEVHYIAMAVETTVCTVHGHG